MEGLGDSAGSSQVMAYRRILRSYGAHLGSNLLGRHCHDGQRKRRDLFPQNK